MFKAFAIFTVTCGIIAYLIIGAVFNFVDRVTSRDNSDAAIAERMRENLLNQTWIQENALTDRTRIVETETTERTRIVEKTKRLGHWLDFFSTFGAFGLAIALCSPLFFLLWSYKKSKEAVVMGARPELQTNLEDWVERLSQEEFEKKG